MSYVNDYMNKKETEAIKKRQNVNYSKEEKKFLNWMNKIELKVKENCGIDLLDFPDQDYMNLFEDKISINEAVQLIINSINPAF
jgi:Cys-tRNA synthase (O-phospho-L-seryl-tRNA:Cys-tRNA synthase)